ncbi:MAG: DUF2437 domain-containing protein, partial [Candidatus Aenigmarchaeota archaeon]|nr:DUF2437 domain-containing protein [Candidatus Aenigmarchaeota archaeon]
MRECISGNKGWIHMKIYRYTHRNKIHWGVLKQDILFELKGSVFRKFK